MLYQVALIRKPTKKQAEDGKLEELIMEPKAVIAADDKTAAIKACKEIDSLDNVEVIVRPFV
ncbi:MAG: hypothetical protein GY861_20040 [bacterium]|nr:hypothetical protein [bacterium]